MADVNPAESLLSRQLRMYALKGKLLVLQDLLGQKGRAENERDQAVDFESSVKKIALKRENQVRRVTAENREKQKIFDVTLGQLAMLGKEIEDLNGFVQALNNLIKKLQKAKALKRKSGSKTRHPQLARYRGNLPWPVTGRVVKTFGRHRHPNLDTVVISNGILIQTEKLGEIRSIKGGEVMYAGEYMGYGQMVLVDHDEGLYSIYGKLSEIQTFVGQKLEKGQTLGLSGRDSNGKNYLYFELRVDGEAEDPVLWLN